MDRYGPHSTLVADFLDEVRASGPDVWASLVDDLRPSEAGVDAAEAVMQVRLSAAVVTSVDADALAAFRSLGLAPEDFPGRRLLARIEDGINTAARALAAGDQLAPQHRAVLLRPFADAGFTSVTSVVGEDAPASTDACADDPVAGP